MNLSSSLALMLSAAAGVEKVQSFSFRLILMMMTCSQLSPFALVFISRWLLKQQFPATPTLETGHVLIIPVTCLSIMALFFRVKAPLILQPAVVTACRSAHCQQTMLGLILGGIVAHVHSLAPCPSPNPSSPPQSMVKTIVYLALGLYVAFNLLILSHVAMHTMTM